MNGNWQLVLMVAVNLAGVAFGSGIVWQKVSDLCRRVERLETRVFNDRNQIKVRAMTQTPPELPSWLLSIQRQQQEQ